MCIYEDLLITFGLNFDGHVKCSIHYVSKSTY